MYQLLARLLPLFIPILKTATNEFKQLLLKIFGLPLDYKPANFELRTDCTT